MPIYEIRQDGLVLAPATTFQALGLQERGDIQRLLRQKIEFLEKGLMVLAEEFSGWLDSKRRIDLLCLDAQAKLVVVELKRDEDGGHMELQALRYAAMVSTMTFDQAVQTHAAFGNPAAPDLATAQENILKFLGWSEPDQGDFAQETRIILAAADFGKEVTTTVLWLRERGIDIRCVRLKPYNLDNNRQLIDIQSLIPLPEAEEFQTRLEDKRKAEQTERVERYDLRIKFLSALLQQANGRSVPHIGRKPSDNGALVGPTGRSGYAFNYVTGQSESRVELLITTEDAVAQLGKFKASRIQIEEAFGGELLWQDKEGSGQRRVYFAVAGGYRSEEEKWPAIHQEMIAAMLRLDAALRPFLEKAG